GKQAGLVTTLGICTGLFVHAVVSALGLSVILARSAVVFSSIKWLGALYLMWLGLQSLMQATSRTQHADMATSTTSEDAPKEAWHAFVEGLLSNTLNPKVAIFYLAFLPQFISGQGHVLSQSIFLASLHFTLTMLWLSLVALLLTYLRTLLTHPRSKRIIEGITGMVLLGFGIRLALERS
ncbi:MAG: LysE family translocator, partial [Deinococcota bacterium]